jgi:hypothetical protein
MVRPLRLCLSVGLVLCLGAAVASADTVTYSASVPLQTTNWSSTLTLPRMDPAIGTLTGVAVEVRDSLVVTIQYENRSPNSGSTLRDSVYATVDVLKPTSGSYVTAISQLYQTGSVGIFDQVVDYAGTSGVTFPDLVDYTSWSSTLTAPGDLAVFTGTGTVSLPCQAVGRAFLSSTGGNNTHIVRTKAAALVLVTYTFTPVSTAAQRSTWGAIKGLYR